MKRMRAGKISGIISLKSLRRKHIIIYFEYLILLSKSFNHKCHKPNKKKMSPLNHMYYAGIFTTTAQNNI